MNGQSPRRLVTFHYSSNGPVEGLMKERNLEPKYSKRIVALVRVIVFILFIAVLCIMVPAIIINI